MKTFRLPDLGEGLQQAEVSEWHVAENDDVAVDQPLLSVETEKALVEIPSPRSGKIKRLLAKPGDLLVVHSTSGNSPNVVRAAEAAHANGVQVLAFSARDGGRLAEVADHCVIVPTDRTDRAQEIQLCIEHAICELVEREL